MNRKELEGKRYISLVRASDEAQAENSTDAQLAMLDDAARRMGMVYVDKIVLKGVTGSLPGRRDVGGVPRLRRGERQLGRPPDRGGQEVRRARRGVGGDGTAAGRAGGAVPARTLRPAAGGLGAGAAGGG